MKIAIIGVGYIGVSTVLHYLKAGVEVVGIDIDKKKVKLLKKGIMPQQDLLKWLGIVDPSFLKKARFYTDFKILDKEIFDAIFIAVPTEKDGEPYFKALDSAINEIFKSKNYETLTIIESTLMPGVCDERVMVFLANFVVAPRRDWFTDKGKTVKTLPRIVGGNTQINTLKAERILGYICNTLYLCHYREAELVKAVENSIRHLGSVYAQELAWAYPDLDIKKILKLASTKWNVPEYYPNILGTAGYCIPLSSKYVVDASGNREDSLTIAQQVIQSDNQTAYKVSRILKIICPKSIGILGVAYLANIKVHILSGALRLLRYLGIEETGDIWTPRNMSRIKVNDPFYTTKELKQITKRKTFRFLNDLDKFEILIVTAGHEQYVNCNKKKLIEKTKNCRFILDNVGIWEDVKFKCPYISVGRSGWLKKIK